MPAFVPSMALKMGFPKFPRHALIDEGGPIERKIGVVVSNVLLFRQGTCFPFRRAAAREYPFLKVV
jgi:hypothetical protein